jgi:hypothetical protein
LDTRATQFPGEPARHRFYRRHFRAACTTLRIPKEVAVALLFTVGVFLAAACRWKCGVPW